MNKLRSAIVLLLALICLPLNALAQKGPELKVLHKPLKSGELPAPGEKFELRAMLQGLRNINLKMRALVVSDGRLMDLSLTGTLDEQDRVIYTTQLPAPLAEINYQFFLYRDDETVLPTQRFSIQRSCLPDVSLLNAATPEPNAAGEVIKDLVRRAKGLERDVRSYARLAETLAALKAVLPQNGSSASEGGSK